ncbi:MAG: pyruvate formate-lyase-activating protein [Eubacteriales bacterium]
MSGKIHSLESFGTVDGPGVRFVVFVQGCPMRCAYCHNPDTWPMNGGTEMNAEEIIADYKRNVSFYNGGGITVTGGEPMMQLPFLLELFTLAKQESIHTCIDTSGIAYHTNDPKWITLLNQVLDVTDLVMLDIKHIDPDKHMEMVKQPNDKILEFAQYLSDYGTDMWIRHVVVPTINDDEDSLYRLGYHIGAYQHLKALDVLPYHELGVSKYENLGIEYPLKGVPSMDKSKVVEKKQIILNGIKARRKELE